MHEDGEVTERWRGPISLALYGVMFQRNPLEHVERIAPQLSMTAEMLDEIEYELAHPTQRVSRILDMRADEESLRAYLRALVNRLRAADPSS